MGSCPSCFHERLNIHSPFAVAPTERTDELHPNLTPQQLREILAAQPEQALAVAVHRHSDEPLRSWLWETGDGELRMAMYKHYLALREQMAAVGQPLPEAAARFDAAVDRAYGQWQAGFAAPPQKTSPRPRRAMTLLPARRFPRCRRLRLPHTLQSPRESKPPRSLNRHSSPNCGSLTGRSCP